MRLLLHKWSIERFVKVGPCRNILTAGRNCFVDDEACDEKEESEGQIEDVRWKTRVR